MSNLEGPDFREIWIFDSDFDDESICRTIETSTAEYSSTVQILQSLPDSQQTELVEYVSSSLQLGCNE